jgi:hypothetical protein
MIRGEGVTPAVATEITCSASTCGKEILGMGVLLCDRWEAGINWAQGNFTTYEGVNPEGGPVTWILLHPNCYLLVFDELLRLQLNAALMMAVGHVSDFREGLGIT